MSSENIMSQKASIAEKGKQVATCVGVVAAVSSGIAMGSYAGVPSNNLTISHNASAYAIALVDVHTKPQHGRLGADKPKDAQETAVKTADTQTAEDKATTVTSTSSETADKVESKDASQTNEAEDTKADEKETVAYKAADKDTDTAIAEEVAGKDSDVQVKTVNTPATSDASNPIVYAILAGVGVLLAILGYKNKKDSEK